MRELNENEKTQIRGGAINWKIIAGIGAVISFIVGIIDGYTNPTKCNN